MTVTRGNRLFASLFDNTQTQVATAVRKGRSSENDARRNECLLARYYFYGRFTDRRYPVILAQLSIEFHLSERTIQNIMQTEYEILHRLKVKQPQISWFRKEWPHLVWAT